MEDQPQTKKVDLFGESFELPADVAEKVIMKRDLHKANDRGDFDERLKQIEAKIKADVEAKAKAQFDEELAKYKSENNIEKVKEMLEQRHSLQLKEISSERDKLKTILVDSSIKDAIRSVDSVMPEVVDDLMLIYKTQFDVTPDGEVRAKGVDQPILKDDGTRIKMIDHIKKFIESKPQYIRANINKGTGASDSSVDAGNGIVNMPKSEYERTVSEGGIKARTLVKKVADGRVVLV